MLLMVYEGLEEVDLHSLYHPPTFSFPFSFPFLSFPFLSLPFPHSHFLFLNNIISAPRMQSEPEPLKIQEKEGQDNKHTVRVFTDTSYIAKIKTNRFSRHLHTLYLQ
jgi:hypothetical protein